MPMIDVHLWPAHDDPEIDSRLPQRFAGFHFERFSQTPVVEGRSFALDLARSGKQIRVADDVSALDAVTTTGVSQHRCVFAPGQARLLGYLPYAGALR